MFPTIGDLSLDPSGEWILEIEFRHELNDGFTFSLALGGCYHVAAPGLVVPVKVPSNEWFGSSIMIASSGVNCPPNYVKSAVQFAVLRIRSSGDIN